MEKKGYEREFEEDIRLFRKYENTVYDILALTEYLSFSNHTFNCGLIGYNLVEKVINDLEDEEVSISYKYINIKTWMNKFYEILNKYKNKDECKQLCDSFSLSYREINCNYYINANKVENINIINHLMEKQHYDMVLRFLSSNISLDKRLEMLGDVFEQIPDDKYFKLDFLFSNDLEKEIIKDETSLKKRFELFKAFNDNVSFKTNILNKLSEKHKSYIITSLQNKTVIDFMSNLPKDFVAAPGIICKNNNNLESFKEIYQSEGYAKLDEEIKTNTNNVILDYINIDQIPEFIKLSNFHEIKEDYISRICNRLMNDNLSKDEFDLLKNYIVNEIVKKSTDKKDYKKHIFYAYYLNTNANYSNASLHKQTTK